MLDNSRAKRPQQKEHVHFGGSINKTIEPVIISSFDIVKQIRVFNSPYLEQLSSAGQLSADAGMVILIYQSQNEERESQTMFSFRPIGEPYCLKANIRHFLFYKRMNDDIKYL